MTKVALDLDSDNIGFEVEQNGENLFEKFHKSKSESNEKVLLSNVVPNETPVNNNTPAELSEEEKAKVALEKQKSEDILASVRNHLSGEKPKPTETPGDDDTNNVFKILYDQNVKKGFWKEVEGLEVVDEESYYEAQRLNDEDRIQEGIQADLLSLFPEDKKENTKIAKDFITHLKNGGAPKDFIVAYSKADIPEQDLKSDDAEVKENAQRTIFFDYWREQGLTEPQISKKFTNAKLKETLEDDVADLFPLLKAKRDSEKAEVLKQTELNSKQKEEKATAVRNTIINTLVNSTEVFGFNFGEDKAEKQALANYMYQATEKEKSGAAVPKFKLDREKLADDPNWILFTAIAAKQISETGKLNFSNIEKQIRNTSTAGLRDQLEQAVIGKRLDIKNNQGGDKGGAYQVEPLDFEDLEKSFIKTS